MIGLITAVILSALALFLIKRKVISVRILRDDTLEEAQAKIDSLPKTTKFGEKLIIYVEEGRPNWNGELKIRGFKNSTLYLKGEGSGAKIGCLIIKDNSKITIK